MSEVENKTALVLAGGGLSGAVYEMGALRAINDLLVDRTVNDFDIFVGTSAGAIVASGLSNGLTPQTMLRSIEGTDRSIQKIRPKHLYRPNAKATLSRLFKLPKTLSDSIQHYRRNPQDLNMFDMIWELSNTLPAALYDGMALETYTRRIFESTGVGNAFADLKKELYIIATSLGNGERIVFGQEPHNRVPISLAVAASTAMPLVYNPVRIGDDEYIDGGMRGTASLDLAIERGAKLVVCVNPLVPYDNNARFGDSDTQYFSDEGMQVMLDQVIRIMLHSGLHYHIKQLRRQHPDVDIILIEPRRDDSRLMFSNIMRYSTRLSIAKHGYESVTLDLAEDYHYFKATLARHGIDISARKVVPQIEKILHANNKTEALEDVLDVVPYEQTQKPIPRLRRILNDIEEMVS